VYFTDLMGTGGAVGAVFSARPFRPPVPYLGLASDFPARDMEAAGSFLHLPDAGMSRACPTCGMSRALAAPFVPAAMGCGTWSRSFPGGIGNSKDADVADPRGNGSVT
jgi:hypothetical protein